MKAAEHRGRRDIDPAARLDPLTQIYRLEFVIGCEQAPAAIEITHAGICQRDRAGRPIEKAGLQLRLKGCDYPRHGS